MKKKIQKWLRKFLGVDKELEDLENRIGLLEMDVEDLINQQRIMDQDILNHTHDINFLNRNI